MVGLGDYMIATRSTAIYPTDKATMYLALGLCGESGEVAEKIKKEYRDGKLDRDGLIKELGDVMWYWARLCDEIGVCPNSVLDGNMKKLLGRKERGVLGGSGDNR